MVPEIKGTMDKVFCHFGPFLPFEPPNNPKNQNFENIKQTSGDSIILYLCYMNDNHMLYSSWDIEQDRQNFLSFWTIFCPFTLLSTWKIKTLKNEQNTWRYHHFYTSVPKIMICYIVPEVWHVMDVIVIFHFGIFFAFYPINNKKKSKFK